MNKTVTISPAACPHCGEDIVIRLPDDWQEQVNAGKAIAIVGCGNPWHYANLDVAAERERIRAAVEQGWDVWTRSEAYAAILAIVDRKDNPIFNERECPICCRIIIKDAHGGEHPSAGDHDPGEHVIFAYGDEGK